MINIVCLKWGNKYGPEYVNRLYAMVRRHTTQDFRFWCLTEDVAGIRSEVFIVPLQFGDTLDSWWNKIWLFSRDLPIPLGEQIFYIDLDTVIVSNIDDLLTDQVPDIVMLRDFYQGIARTAGQVGSGLMSWRHGSYEKIWQDFIQNPVAAIKSVHPHGDQAWVERCIDAWYCWQDLFPGRVVSFKIDCADGLPPGSSIICYHGRPSIPDSITQSVDHSTAMKKWTSRAAPWIAEHWREN